jgi:hypothetical protein
MNSADDVLRRRFIAIAAGNFAANASYPTLDVASDLNPRVEQATRR